jgi:ATP synthase, Delta/Epsilon chain, beta-sandwich domain
MSDQPAAQPGVDQQQVIVDDVVAAPLTQAEQEQAQAVGDLNRRADTKRQSMHLKVYSPFRSYYDGQAFSITAENDTGLFDILPKHHNFISLLNACELVIRSADDDDQRIRISGGIMHVKADRVVVFLDV